MDTVDHHLPIRPGRPFEGDRLAGLHLRLLEELVPLPMHLDILEPDVEAERLLQHHLDHAGVGDLAHTVGRQESGPETDRRLRPDQVSPPLEAGIPSDYIFTDVGISGAVSPHQRPGFQKMIEAIQAGGITHPTFRSKHIFVQVLT